MHLVGIINKYIDLKMQEMDNFKIISILQSPGHSVSRNVGIVTITTNFRMDKRFGLVERPK